MVLTYQNVQADPSDVSAHWNPAGGANGTGRTIPHLSQLVTNQDPKEAAAGSQNKWSFGYDGNGNLTSVSEPLFPNNPAITAYNSDGTCPALLRRGWSDLALRPEEAERHQVDLLELRIRPQREHQRPGAERAGEQGLGDATLYINGIPCPSPRGCAAMLPSMLPGEPAFG